ncbi:MAG: hypothetical protein OK438_04870 [Thaumarchaeota archaeon]|nr:hypothetical protein [Nitrososphaerota archaeon]
MWTNSLTDPSRNRGVPVTFSTASWTRSGLPLFSESLSLLIAEWWKLLSSRIREASSPLLRASLTTAGLFKSSLGISSRADSASTKLSFTVTATDE